MAKRKQKKSFSEAIKESKDHGEIANIALNWAIKVVGTPTEFARILEKETGVSTSKQAVHGWQQGGSVPYKRVLDVEKVAGISRYYLAPDVCGEPPSGWLEQLEQIRADIIEQRCAEAADASALWGE